MDRRELAAITDFVLTVIWPSRTYATVTAGGGQTVFPIIGTWNTTYDTPMVWVNGNRYTGTATLTGASQVTLSTSQPLGTQVIILVTPGSGTGYLPRNPAGAAMLGSLNMGNLRITDLANAVNPTDAVPYQQITDIVNTLLGGNYVLKAGSDMSGNLGLPVPAPLADEGGSDVTGTPLTKAARRNEVVRKAVIGTQTLTGKLATPETVDGDGDTILTTKKWVLRRFQSIAFPDTEVRLIPGATSWTNPHAIDLVVYLYLAAGGGGGGGRRSDALYGQGMDGGRGAKRIKRIVIPASAIVPVVIGGGGGGGSGPTGGDFRTGGGGGGGGSTKITIDGVDYVVGGGAGGGGAGDDSSPPSAGGAAAAAGQNGNGTGGVAGLGGLNTHGGLPGNGSPSPTVGGDGTASHTDDAVGWIFADVADTYGNKGLGGSTSGTAGSDGIIILRYAAAV